MKIVMLCDFYNHTLQYQESLLVKYYIKQGHQVTVITSTFESVFDYTADRYDKTIPASEVFEKGTKIIKLPFSMNILNRLRRFGGVDKILDTEQPDIIFSHNILLNLREAVKYKKKHSECKIIVDYHADYSNSAKNWLSLNILHKVIRRSFFYLISKHIDKIYPIKPAGSVFLNEVYGIPYERMGILPLGVDIDVCNEIRLQNKGKAIKEKLGIPDDAFVIFSGGKLDPLKKTELLIEAVNTLSDPRVHVVIVGETAESNVLYKAELDALSQNNKNIHFAGWLSGDETYEYMDASDIAVFPASQSVLWQQSIGMGLPLIVGTHKGQEASYLNMNDNVIILEEDQITAQKIEKNIERLVEDTTLLDTMRKGALKTSEEYLSYDKIARQTLNF